MMTRRFDPFLAAAVAAALLLVPSAGLAYMVSNVQLTILDTKVQKCQYTTAKVSFTLTVDASDVKSPDANGDQEVCVTASLVLDEWGEDSDNDNGPGDVPAKAQEICTKFKVSDLPKSLTITDKIIGSFHPSTHDGTLFSPDFYACVSLPGGGGVYSEEVEVQTVEPNQATGNQTAVSAAIVAATRASSHQGGEHGVAVALTQPVGPVTAAAFVMATDPRTTTLLAARSEHFETRDLGEGRVELSLRSDRPVHLPAGVSLASTVFDVDALVLNPGEIRRGGAGVRLEEILFLGPSGDEIDVSEAIALGADQDLDGLPTLVDPDIDGDGFPNDADVFPLDPEEVDDVDADRLGDRWELEFFGDLSQSGDEDADGDGRSNLQEFLTGTVPFGFGDGDGDGVPDALDLWPADPTLATDQDGDGVGDRLDRFPSDPRAAFDDDGDGLADGWERYWLGSLDATDGTGDSDGDGLTDLEELDAGSDPVTPPPIVPDFAGGGRRESRDADALIFPLAVNDGPISGNTIVVEAGTQELAFDFGTSEAADSHTLRLRWNGRDLLEGNRPTVDGVRVDVGAPGRQVRVDGLRLGRFGFGILEVGIRSRVPDGRGRRLSDVDRYRVVRRRGRPAPPPPPPGGPKADLVINEVLFDPAGHDAGAEVIEILNRDAEPVDVAGWQLADAAGRVLAELDGVVEPGSFLVVHLGPGTVAGLGPVSGDRRDLFTGAVAESLDNDADGVALFAGPARTAPVVDYVAWSTTGRAPSGAAHHRAVAAGAWDRGDHLDTSVRAGHDIVQEGSSIGRDGVSTDTDEPQDWGNHGGDDARVPTLGTANRGPAIDADGLVFFVQEDLNALLQELGRFAIEDARHDTLEVDGDGATMAIVFDQQLTFRRDGAFHPLAGRTEALVEPLGDDGYRIAASGVLVGTGAETLRFDLDRTWTGADGRRRAGSRRLESTYIDPGGVATSRTMDVVWEALWLGEERTLFSERRRIDHGGEVTEASGDWWIARVPGHRERAAGRIRTVLPGGSVRRHRIDRTSRFLPDGEIDLRLDRFTVTEGDRRVALGAPGSLTVRRVAGAPHERLGAFRSDLSMVLGNDDSGFLSLEAHQTSRVFVRGDELIQTIDTLATLDGAVVFDQSFFIDGGDRNLPARTASAGGWAAGCTVGTAWASPASFSLVGALLPAGIAAFCGVGAFLTDQALTPDPQPPPEPPDEETIACFFETSAGPPDCQDLTPGDCASAGGTPAGAGSNCATAKPPGG